MKTNFTLSIIYILGSFFNYAVAREKNRPTSVAEMLGNVENIAIIERPDAVDVCFLRYIADSKQNGGDGRYEELEFFSVPSVLVTIFQGKLLDESIYRWNSATVCWPRYQTRLRFRRDKDVVTVDFCFECRVLLIRRNGIYVDSEVFDDRSKVFLTSMRKLFPGNVALAKVK